MIRLIFIALILFSSNSFAKTVRYELIISEGVVNMSGKKDVDFALMVNGKIPAPTLEFTEGDEAQILVTNRLEKEETSLHWHGILLPPEEDGVAYVNTPPIFPGQSRLFRFPIRQHGTYWYHSHTMVQEQKGVYGAIVIHPKKEQIHADKDVVAVISDWSDEDADQILRNLRKDGDYYLYKKDSVRSYWGAMEEKSLGNHLKNEWQRMGGMDLSDVGYDAFLINGKKDSQLVEAKAGDVVRIRVINAGASSYFYVSMGKTPFQVVAADGVEISPVWTNEILLGMAETYDIVFKMPADGNYELRATAQDVTGSASVWIGKGEKVFAPVRAKPDLYMSMDHSMMGHDMSTMDHSASAQMQGMDHSKMDHSMMDHSKMNHSKSAGSVIDLLTVDALKAKAATTLPVNAPVHEVKLVLGGDMERYVWHINGKAIHEDRTLQINEGDVVRYTFVNETMMHHPMHLHGHFFRVLNKNGEFSPLKHTVDVPPHGSRTIEFYANEPGEWMLHCHNLYHMKTGMARVVQYSTFKPTPAIAHHQGHDPHLHEHLYWDGQVEAATNRGRIFFRLSKTWDTLELNAETRAENKHWEIDGDIFYRRWMGQYLNFVGGATSFGEHQRAIVGVSYELPFMLHSALYVDSKAAFRMDLGRKFQWTKNIFSEAELTWRQHEKLEWDLSLMYGPSWHWAAGLTVTEDKIGAGALVKF